MEKTTYINIRVKPDLKEALEEYCEENDVSKSFVVTRLLLMLLQDSVKNSPKPARMCG